MQLQVIESDFGLQGRCRPALGPWPQHPVDETVEAEPEQHSEGDERECQEYGQAAHRGPCLLGIALPSVMGLAKGSVTSPAASPNPRLGKGKFRYA